MNWFAANLVANAIALVLFVYGWRAGNHLADALAWLVWTFGVVCIGFGVLA